MGGGDRAAASASVHASEFAPAGVHARRVAWSEASGHEVAKSEASTRQIAAAERAVGAPSRTRRDDGARPQLLLLFLDGVGVGGEDPAHNPFHHARLPVLTSIMGGIPDRDARPFRGGQRAVAFMDARLDVAGTPQSGTGQVALLTGANAAQLFGGHFGPWTPVALRPLVETESVLRRALDAGRTVAFANAYPKGWPGERARRRVAGPPLAARGAGVLDRHEEALAVGEAVSSEIVNDGWIHHLGHATLPAISAEDAGRNLAAVSAGYDLTLYAHYATDTAGHRKSMAPAVSALERVDRFLSGVVERLPVAHTLMLVSDHGNIEDVRTGHTRNPALGVVVGKGADGIADCLRSLMDVTDVVLQILEVPRTEERR